MLTGVGDRLPWLTRWSFDRLNVAPFSVANNDLEFKLRRQELCCDLGWRPVPRAFTVRAPCDVLRGRMRVPQHGLAAEKHIEFCLEHS